MHIVYLDCTRLELPKRIALAVMLIMGKRTRVTSPRVWVTLEPGHDGPRVNWSPTAFREKTS
jgi:hypothetical protein